ncbi:hypothetical protein Hanom_Chr06g00544971 [Helianthus anomalus]
MSGLFESGLCAVQPKPERRGGLRRQSSVADFGTRGPEAIQNPLNLRKNASTAANMTELASSYTPLNPDAQAASLLMKRFLYRPYTRYHVFLTFLCYKTGLSNLDPISYEKVDFGFVLFQMPEACQIKKP